MFRKREPKLQSKTHREKRLVATVKQRLRGVQAVRRDALHLDSLPVEHGPQSLFVGSVHVEEIAIERRETENDVLRRRHGRDCGEKQVDLAHWIRAEQRPEKQIAIIVHLIHLGSEDGSQFRHSSLHIASVDSIPDPYFVKIRFTTPHNPLRSLHKCVKIRDSSPKYGSVSHKNSPALLFRSASNHAGDAPSITSISTPPLRSIDAICFDMKVCGATYATTQR